MSKKNRSHIAIRTKLALHRVIKTCRSPQGKEIFTFLGFVILAACFWFILAISDKKERSVQIPLEMVNVPEETVLLNNIPPYVDARIKDKVSVILGYNLDAIDPIKIEFNEHDNGKGTVTVSNNEILDYLRQHLKTTTTILSYSPDSIRIAYTRDAGKKCPIEVRGTFTALPHCILGDSIYLSPDSVTVYGKAATLQKIDKIYTEEIVAENLKDTTHITAQLRGVADTRIIPEKVTVTIPVEEYTTKTLSVPIIIGNTPEGYAVMTFPSHIELSCMIPMSLYGSTTSDDFLVGIDFAALLENRTPQAAVELINSPDFARSITFSQDSVDYIINEISSITKEEDATTDDANNQQ